MKLLIFFLLFVVTNARILKDHHHEDKERLYTMCENFHGEMYYFKEKHYGYDDKYCHKKLAKVKYSNKINETGWAFLEAEIATEDEISFHKQGYVLGFLEGRATRDLISQHIHNTIDGYCDGAEEYCKSLNEYLLKNYLWMLKEIKENYEDEYFQQVNMTINHIKGMIDGFAGVINQNLRPQDIVVHPIYYLQLAGDLEDLQSKFKKPDNPKRLKTGRGRCSALVKLIPGDEDLYFSHVTWSSFSSLLRMQKKYTFNTGDPGQRYAFSGYPGTISSVDDFIVTSAKLAILETTIGNYNESLYRYMTSKSILTWIRSQIAHRTSSSALQWAMEFAKLNSGTYNNQWVVVDYKKFRRGRRQFHGDGLMHVLEQMPKHIVQADMSKKLLDDTYWPSYNSPYFKQIFRWSNAQQMVDKYGDWFTYEKTPRALIFARDHGSVVDMDSMIRLMRSNNYTQDPLSRCDCDPPYSGENAISCRSDLNPKNGTYPFESLGFRDHAATDMKLTNSKLIEKLQFVAIAGPTHDPTPVFDWSQASFKDKVPHLGQPQRWEFKPVTHSWTPGGLFASSQINF